MATLAGQRAQFTWALNQYNLAEDEDRRAFYARRMARYIANAPANGFTVDDVTQGQLYPIAEVAQYLESAKDSAEPDITEGQALREVADAVPRRTCFGSGMGRPSCTPMDIDVPRTD
jgi:hypothetical protein